MQEPAFREQRRFRPMTKEFDREEFMGLTVVALE
jgi:hypothetical protein